MRFSLATLALAALAAAEPVPQGVTSAIAPQGSAPAGCSSSYPGTFQIQVVNVTKSGSKVKRQSGDNALTLTLANGILKDAKGRIGYIAANSQFQFDGPPQTGAIYTAGWSVCANNSLAIGPNALFYSCLSGTFYNLYEYNNAAQCAQVYIEAVGGSSSGGVAGQSSDGQATATGAASQRTDGQVTASPKASQISDGQVQATTGTARAVSQISDGQPQAPKTTSSGAKVSQISDGQVQATTAARATTSAGPRVSQISDGQIQATRANSTVASATASAQRYTGAAMPTAVSGELFGLAAGVLAMAML